MNSQLIDKIIAFGHADDDIRAILLEGSIAAGLAVDELSDYDINIYSRDYARYISDDEWMNQFGEVLLYQKEVFQFYDVVQPTRLVVFKNGERIDFSFWSPSLLADMAHGEKEYASYKNGYRVLVDKDGQAAQLRPPDGSGFSITPPSRDKFLQTLYDFWFEAYCVARYLARRDLWFAKRIEDSYIKDHVYRMMLWQHQAEHGWPRNPILHTEGKRFEKWASPELLDEIPRCYAPYDVPATWASLFAMVGLFSRVARETAGRLGIEYPKEKEREVIEYLQRLKVRPANRLEVTGENWRTRSKQPGKA